MKLKWLAAVGVVVIAAAGGIAYASIPDGSGVIHGCYATKDGSLRVIDPSASQSCDPKRESALDWNAQGPPGVQGPAGPAGAQGPSGPQGPAGATHGYETNKISTIKANVAQNDVVSISGLPDGNYLVWAQVNAFGTPGDILYCYIEGENFVGYTDEEELSANLGGANDVIVSRATLTGGNSTVWVDCGSSFGNMDTYSALSLTRVDALN